MFGTENRCIEPKNAKVKRLNTPGAGNMIWQLIGKESQMEKKMIKWKIRLIGKYYYIRQ